MDVGVVYFFTDDGPDPVEFAQAAESYGFESIFLPEHSHFPVTRKTPYPAVYGGGDLPDFYKHTLDQIVTLSVIGASTTKLKLGTGITLLAQHDPIWKAHELATLDHLTNGRVICGVGYGWNRDEAEAHGVDWPSRFSNVRDKVAIMRSIWTDDVAQYEGTYASLAPSWSWPKPTQAAGIRVYLGGAGPTTMREAADWADAWYVVPPPDDATLEKSIPKFWKVVEEQGRDPKSIGIAVASAPPDASILEKYEAQGVERAALWVDPANSPAQGMKNLEVAANALKEYKG
jgi:probable F420-dependent oxidoreductase